MHRWSYKLISRCSLRKICQKNKMTTNHNLKMLLPVCWRPLQNVWHYMQLVNHVGNAQRVFLRLLFSQKMSVVSVLFNCFPIKMEPITQSIAAEGTYILRRFWMMVLWETSTSGNFSGFLWLFLAIVISHKMHLKTSGAVV